MPFSRWRLWVVFLFYLFTKVNSAGFPWVGKNPPIEGKCNLSSIGYKPGGAITTVERLVAPTAQLEKTLLDKIAGKSSMSANLIMHSVNTGKAFTTVTETSMEAVKFLVNLAPKLASTLGVFGAVFAFVADATKPSAQDIIDSTNAAFDELTSEMNDRLDQMKGYVDGKIIDLEKTLINRELKVMQNIWFNCADELICTEVINECQRDAARYIRASKPKFLLFTDKKRSNTPLDRDTVKRAEASLFAFKKYANLAILNGDTVAGSYELKANESEIDRKYFLRYIQRLIDDIKEFKDHAYWISNETIRVHTTNGGCYETLSCDEKATEVVAEGWFGAHIADTKWCRCLFDATLDNSQVCKINVTKRVDGEQPSDYEKSWPIDGRDAFETVALRYLQMRLYSRFTEDIEKYIKDFWQSELFTEFEEWNDIIEKAEERKAAVLSVDKKEKRKKKKKKKVNVNVERRNIEFVTSEDMILTDEYSPNFKRRLDKAKSSIVL